MKRVRVGRQAAVLGLIVLALTAAAGAWGVARWSEPHGQQVDIASLPAETAARYRFVEQHPALAGRIPCYCGCGISLGHDSLKDCYLERDGYSDHAVNCLICGRIAADVERLNLGGADTASIRKWIDLEYAQFGPPTDTAGG